LGGEPLTNGLSAHSGEFAGTCRVAKIVRIADGTVQ
jgi:hypothetical protein